MGWTGIITNKTIKEVLLNDFNNEHYEVIDTSIQSGVSYLAIKRKETGEVFAEICLTATQQYNGQREVRYKNMSECMGPFYYGCPHKILDKLSPTENAESLKWRETCRTRKEKEKELADKISTLTSGTKLGEYTYVGKWAKGGKYSLIVQKGYSQVRITPARALQLLETA